MGCGRRNATVSTLDNIGEGVTVYGATAEGYVSIFLTVLLYVIRHGLVYYAISTWALDWNNNSSTALE